MGTRWSEGELALLRDVSLSLAEVAARTGRTPAAVSRKASYLGIRRPVIWTAAELALVDDVSLSCQEIASQVGRSLAAVQRMAFLRRAYRRRWSREELALLYDDTLTYTEIAGRVGRQENAVKVRAYALGIRRGAARGERHPNWVGGASKKSRSWRGEDWPVARRAALERDGYCCQACGTFDPSGRQLRVHHVIPYRLRPSNDLCWLVTLCEPCHRKRPEHRWREIPEGVFLLLG